MTKELKPCPFCGGEAQLEKLSGLCLAQGEGRNGHKYYVYCSKCFAISNATVDYGQTEEECCRIVRGYWNRRANDGT